MPAASGQQTQADHQRYTPSVFSQHCHGRHLSQDTQPQELWYTGSSIFCIKMMTHLPSRRAMPSRSEEVSKAMPRTGYSSRRDTRMSELALFQPSSGFVGARSMGKGAAR